MPKKIKVALIAVLVICLAAMAAGTIAYFTTSATARNVITTGGIDIEVREYQMVNNDRVDYPSEKILVMPGTTVSKIATVEAGEETQPAWVRMRVSAVVYDPQYKDMELDAATIASFISIDFDSENWTEHDGWWYYGEKLSKGETEPLFEEVRFSGPNMTNEYQNCTVEILVEAQAVQCANNGATALEAEGWSESK